MLESKAIDCFNEALVNKKLLYQLAMFIFSWYQLVLSSKIQKTTTLQTTPLHFDGRTGFAVVNFKPAMNSDVEAFNASVVMNKDLFDLPSWLFALRAILANPDSPHSLLQEFCSIPSIRYVLTRANGKNLM